MRLRTARVRFSSGILLAACCLSFGCTTVGPDYEVPTVAVPDAWDAKLPQGFATGEGELDQWWERFEDPVLTELIEGASAGNLDLRTAVQRIDEARARLGLERSARAPRVDAGAGYARSRQSSQATLGGKTLGDVFDVSDVDNYSIGVSAAWEVDLFGRIHRAMESAQASWEASIEDYHGVLVSLRAEIALVYIDVRTLQRRIVIAERNVSTQRQSSELVRLQYAAGTARGLDRALAEAEVATTEASLPLLRARLRLAINRLSILSGKPPGSLNETLAAPQPIPSTPQVLLVGIPADLLRQRPDVRRAERLLAAQTARVGMATAELYPQFSLDGTFGYSAQAPGDLFQAATRAFSVGPSLVWNVFDGQRLRRSIEVEEARVQQALSSYEQTVLLALEDVEGALTNYGYERERNVALRQAVETYREAVGFADELYRGGATNFESVLDAQRNLRIFEDQLATSNAAQVAHLVALYRAMGGGWRTRESAEAPIAVNHEKQEDA